MRMWNVDPTMLCTQHLLGEHLEMHMFRGTIVRGRSIDGFIRNGLVETGRIVERHDVLAMEMARRGMNHKSPLEQFDVEARGSVDVRQNEAELASRCFLCRRRLEGGRNESA